MDESAVQQQLEGLLDKFFSGTNEEKLQINKILDEFSQQKGVLHYCVYFLQHSSNQHVLMYALTVCETVVTKLWSSLSAGELTELCQFLMSHVLAHHNELPNFIKNKLVQVTVLAVRVIWPQEYSEYFNDIFKLIPSQATTSLGLLFLLTTSEEFTNVSSDFISSQRKEELQEQVQLKVPSILSLVLGILESVAERQRQSMAPTPPPSPDVSPIKNPGSPMTHPNSSPFGTPPPSLGVVRNRLVAPLATPKASPLVSGTVYAPLDQASEEICVVSLKCLAQLFSWMSLSSVITPPILETVFHYASLGCDSATDKTLYSGNLGSLAMDCINELLVKNCVPREFEAFLMKLFEKSFSLLQRLTGEDEHGVSCNFSQLDDKFLAKCSDFFYWFVSSHLKRVEFNPHFPVLEFLGLFYKYTFKQPEPDSFCVCLDIWAVFLDHLILMSSDSYGRQSPPSGNHYERYKSVLVGMMESVLRKALLQYNIDELREIDDDAIDDDNETEWQSFLRQCLEFIGKVAELFPSEAFHLLLPLLEQYSQIYCSVGQLITGAGNSRRLAVAEGGECENLHAVLKDLASVLQALGRLAEHFIGERFTPRFSDALLLVNKFCLLAKYSTENMLFNVSNPTPEVLDHDFIELHAQILGTLQAYTHWFAQLHLDCLRREGHTHIESTLLPLITTIVDSSVAVISHEVPEKIVLVACQLLLSMATTVRPRFLPSLLPVGELMRRATSGTLSLLPHKGYLMVHNALALMLVLPWPEMQDSAQHWEERSGQFSALMSGCTGALGQLVRSVDWEQNTQLQQQTKPELKCCLSLLENIVSSVAHEGSKSKVVLFTAVSPSVEVAISLFPVFLHQPDILDLLMAFFLSLFSSLKAQVSPALTERTVQTFMALLTREHLLEALDSDGSLGAKVIEKFLHILQLLVQDTGGSGKSLLPDVVSFCLDQIYPIIAEKSAPDIKLALFGLFHQMLLNNWRYFSLTPPSGGPSQQDKFFKIMECFWRSLAQDDMTVFKHNLSSLESLNSKHKLYSRPHFQSMLYLFLQLLVGVLVRKSHALLAEEVCLCIYNMAAVDFSVYQNQFLPKYIESSEELNFDQKSKLARSCKMAEDFPSFIQNLRQFVSDTRYFAVMNSTLPENSVKLS